MWNTWPTVGAVHQGRLSLRALTGVTPDGVLCAILGAAIGAALAGCGGDPPAPAVQVTDSAGVRVTVSADRAQSFAVVDSVPILGLGGPDAAGPLQFSNVRAMRVDAAGGLWVVDGASNEVRLFGPDGSHRSTAGGAGEGPGEFRSIRLLGDLPGDSVAFWDEALARVAVLDPGGAFARTVPLAQGEQVGPQPRGTYPDGSLLVVWRRTLQATALEPGSVLPDSSRLARFDIATAAVTPQVSVPGPVWIWNGRGQAPVPFTVNAPYQVQGERVLVSWGPAFRVRAFADGRLVESFGVDRGTRAVTDANVRAYIDLYADAFPDTVRRNEYLAPMDHPARPRYLPAYHRILTDADGRVWASVYQPDLLAATTWDVYERDRSYLGAVRTPPGFTLMAIRPDRLFGVWRDDFGVEYVRVHGMLAPDPPTSR